MVSLDSLAQADNTPLAKRSHGDGVHQSHQLQVSDQRGGGGHCPIYVNTSQNQPTKSVVTRVSHPIPNCDSAMRFYHGVALGRVGFCCGRGWGGLEDFAVDWAGFGDASARV